MKHFFNRNARKIAFITAFSSIFTLLGTIICNWEVKHFAGQYLYESLEEIPYNKVGLVLGTSKYIRTGVPNPYFQYRMEAAAKLFWAGKISYILLSGDNGTIYYNEPMDMRKALLKMGIPKDRIYLDFAGFRTLDSVVRCKEVFGQNRFTVISQPFHNERAVYISRQSGIEAIAFNAKDVNLKGGMHVQAREIFARVKTMLDLFITHEKPKFLGTEIEIQ
jgi:SanA protein